MAAMRTTAQGDQIEVDLVHDFIRCALTHDAIADPVFELLYEHVVGGRRHPSLERRPRRIAANLLLDTLRPTLRAMRAARAGEPPTALESRELRPVWPTAAEDGDLDALLAEAVAAGAITRKEAELVAVTRFDGVPLAHLAELGGQPYNRLKVRRQRAERRLLVWMGYRPVPRRPQNRHSSHVPVPGAGSHAQAGASCSPSSRREVKTGRVTGAAARARCSNHSHS
ncbi:MAG: sigma-70 family RNA polymerase sigma factor [Actinobacteria bacterium]|nr:sigma-70 family RNA polymerase sigma factor [Actinomycetota bacterium]